jgi:hypothetical protein
MEHHSEGGIQHHFRSAQRNRSSSTGSSRRDSVTSTTSSNDLDDSTGIDLPSPVSGASGDGLTSISEVSSRHARCEVTVEIPKASVTNDPVRQKSREMLSSAIKLAREYFKETVSLIHDDKIVIFSWFLSPNFL